MSDSPDPGTPPEGTPPEVRFLKRLVTTLTVVMIAGFLTIVALLVIRLVAPPAPLPVLPENLTLPAGARPAAVTLARDWVVVVTEAGEILLYDRATGGEPVQRLMPEAPEAP